MSESKRIEHLAKAKAMHAVFMEFCNSSSNAANRNRISGKIGDPQMGSNKLSPPRDNSTPGGLGLSEPTSCLLPLVSHATLIPKSTRQKLDTLGKILSPPPTT
jgi:hypothetical protein